MRINFKNLNFTRLFNLESIEKKTIYIVSLAVFVVFNLLVFYLLPFRLDFSFGQAHTLSKATKNILRKLDDVVNFKIFISSDLPIRLSGLRTDVVDLIKEYQKESNGKVIIKILDPKKDDSALNEAKELGVPELQFSQIEKDKYAVSATYFGMVIQYGDKREVIPQLTNLESLEYDITSIIYKLTRKEPLKLGVMGAEELVANPQQDDFFSLKKILSQQFDLNYITEKIDPTIKTVLILDDNKKTYATAEGEMLVDFIKKQKGKAIFIVDGISIGEGLTTQEPTHNLFLSLSSFGIKLNKNLVLSYSSQMASFTTGVVSFFTPYPFWVKTTNFQNIGELSNIGVLTFPWVSSVDLEKSEGIETRVLVKSEKNSWEQKDNFILNPNNIPEPAKNDLKEFNLIVEAKIKDGGALTLIPSSRFIKEQFIQQNNGNINFLLNQLSSYASEGALSGIRSRMVVSVPLKNISESSKDLVKYLNILLLPGLTTIFALIRLYQRK